MGFMKNGIYRPTLEKKDGKLIHNPNKLSNEDKQKYGISHSNAGVDKRGCVMCGSKTRKLTEHTCGKCINSMF
jgi:hypothetical protein